MPDKTPLPIQVFVNRQELSYAPSVGTRCGFIQENAKIQNWIVENFKYLFELKKDGDALANVFE